MIAHVLRVLATMVLVTAALLLVVAVWAGGWWWLGPVVLAAESLVAYRIATDTEPTD